jgi:hypothetical protein
MLVGFVSAMPLLSACGDSGNASRDKWIRENYPWHRAVVTADGRHINVYYHQNTSLSDPRIETRWRGGTVVITLSLRRHAGSLTRANRVVRCSSISVPRPVGGARIVDGAPNANGSPSLAPRGYVRQAERRAHCQPTGPPDGH